jgi:hypothetical protein
MAIDSCVEIGSAEVVHALVDWIDSDLAKRKLTYILCIVPLRGYTDGTLAQCSSLAWKCGNKRSSGILKLFRCRVQLATVQPAASGGDDASAS